MSRKFTKTVENFICEHCGVSVVGNGFTNHCPECLWSKHVDQNPGDRRGDCGGLMKPVGVFGSPGSELLHECVRCGFSRKNKIAKNDNFEAVLRVARERGEKN